MGDTAVIFPPEADTERVITRGAVFVSPASVPVCGKHISEGRMQLIVWAAGGFRSRGDVIKLVKCP